MKDIFVEIIQEASARDGFEVSYGYTLGWRKKSIFSGSSLSMAMDFIQWIVFCNLYPE